MAPRTCENRAVLPRTPRQAICAAWLTLLCLLSSAGARAQDRPVVFLHGIGSSPETWAATAERLRTRLALHSELPATSSTAIYEVQAAEVQGALHWLGGDAVAVGHSNGGIVARQWQQQHDLSGIVTVGTPHAGAPLVQNLASYAGFNYYLVSTISGIYNAFAAGCCDWQWLLNHYHPYWSLAINFSDLSLREVAVAIGLTAGAPVALEMIPNSPYLSGLNSSWNLAREAATVPTRVGIVSVAHNFYWGGPMRAAFPDYGDTLAMYRDIARMGMVVSANIIYGTATSDSFWAQYIAGWLMAGSFYLSVMDEWWCQAVSTPGFGQCWENDTVVPVWSQAYPGGLSLLASFDGPAHTQEARLSDAILESVLINQASIPPRQSPPAPPPPGGADLTVYEHIWFEGESLPTGGSMSFVGWEWNDRLSSIRAPAGRTVVLYEHADFQGQSLALTGDVGDLRDHAGPGVDGTWNDVVSSIQVF